MQTQSIALRLLLLVLRLFLAGLFLYAAYGKMQDPQKFVFAVKGFKVLPDHLAVLTTYAVPWTEAICGLLLILGLWTRAAALTITFTLLVFIAALASVIFRHIDVKCTCFGGKDFLCSGTVGWCNIIQNTGLLGVALVLAAKGGGFLALDRGDRR